MNELLVAKPLLFLAVGGIVLAAAGWMFEREHPERARVLSRIGYLGLVAALLLQVGALAFSATKSDSNMILNAHPALTVSGRETRVPMAPDGHFWVKATVNGTEHNFLIDTGASYTGMSQGAAAVAGIDPEPNRLPLRLDTANGTISATIGRAGSLSFGNVTVTGLEVAVPVEVDDDTNVIGMNLLSQLASLRVEGQTLVLVPKA